jgi:hypothetical protein
LEFLKNKNKVIVVYDSVTGERNVIRQPSNSQSLDFETVEVIKIMLYLFLPLLFRLRAS